MVIKNNIPEEIGIDYLTNEERELLEIIRKYKH
jgi:hypothetical protein